MDSEQIDELLKVLNRIAKALENQDRYAVKNPRSCTDCKFRKFYQELKEQTARDNWRPSTFKF
jgi:predicted Zn-ribbon and HTH transcriptional regulator